MASCEYRLLAHEQDGEIWLEIHEVYFDKNGIIDGCSKDGVSIHGGSVRGIKWNLEKMLLCIKKTILWYGDKFPNECTPVYTCNVCDRNGFQEPNVAHICSDNCLHKHKLNFSTSYK